MLKKVGMALTAWFSGKLTKPVNFLDWLKVSVVAGFGVPSDEAFVNDLLLRP
jgi:hypothetical protein